MYRFIFLTFGLFEFNVAVANSPVQVVEEFVSSEFNLVEDARQNLAVYENGTALILGQDLTADSIDPIVVISISSDESFLVKEYKILSDNLDQTIPTVSVRFNTVCEVKIGNSETASFSRKSVSVDVAYQLKNIAGVWKVLNPPKPYLSVDQYVEHQKAEINSLKRIVEMGLASSAQKTSLKKAEYRLSEAQKCLE